MAIIIALLATLGTGSTIFYFLQKRRKKRVYGIVLKKAENNIVYIGYLGKCYPAHVSNRQYDALKIRSKVAIKVWFNEPSGNVSIFLD